MGARIGGKIKTVTYITAVGTALLAEGFERMGVFSGALPVLKTAALIVFCISVVLSIISFFDYFLMFRRTEKNTDAGV